jgi:hypothetical protein
VAVAELLANGRHRLLTDKESTEHFVLALACVGGLDEEGSVTRIVHDGTSKVWGIFRESAAARISYRVGVRTKKFPGPS